MLISEKNKAQIRTSVKPMQRKIPGTHAQTGMVRFLDSGAGGIGGAYTGATGAGGGAAIGWDGV